MKHGKLWWFADAVQWTLSHSRFIYIYLYNALKLGNLMNRQNYSRRTFTRYFMSEQICELELFAFNAICQSKSVLFFLRHYLARLIEPSKLSALITFSKTYTNIAKLWISNRYIDKMMSEKKTLEKLRWAIVRNDEMAFLVEV